jgi:hypothetical protein
MCVQNSKKTILLKSLLMIERVGETDGCMGEWKKLVVEWESGRNWWMHGRVEKNWWMHGRVEETDGCSREW